MTKLSYEYIPQLPHDKKWSQGYKLSTNCETYLKKMVNPNGPNDGETLNLNNLPKDAIYIRFWAARPNSETWSSFQSAYDEFKSTYERMPSPKYDNGGMVKVNNGIVSFKLRLPEGYQDKNSDHLIPSHFHYRLCQNNKLGPVHTQFISD